MRDELIEEVARALHSGMSLGVWSDITDHMREHWRHQARAALDALSAHLTANGLKIVAREPTRDMCRGVNESSLRPDANLEWTWAVWFDAAPDVLRAEADD